MQKYIKRFKNPLLVTSILSLIFIILNLSGIVNLSNEKVDFLINLILTILVLLGLVNNPENKIKGFKESVISKQEIESFEDQDDWS